MRKQRPNPSQFSLPLVAFVFLPNCTTAFLQSSLVVSSPCRNFRPANNSFRRKSSYEFSFSTRASDGPHTPLPSFAHGLNDVGNSDNNCVDLLPRSPVGVIFDMDGTLVEHCIDFADMRRRIYQVADSDPAGKHLSRGCVLELAEKLSTEGQAKAAEIFCDIEQSAIRDMNIMPGAENLVNFLKQQGINRAVLTRNVESSVAHMQQLYRRKMKIREDEEVLFRPIVARDTLALTGAEQPLKSKPQPAGILHICSVWNCHPSQVIMVGDSSADDIVAANRAGCGGSVLLIQADGKQLDTDSGNGVGSSEVEVRERTPSLVVESLSDFKSIMEVLLAQGSKGNKPCDGDFSGENTGVNSIVEEKIYN